MCGICGWVDLEGRAATPVVEAMAEALEHRGPDGRGIWRDPSGTAVLGHRRLAVLDTSSAGAQPMVDRLTGAVLVFNGEVYNFAELRTVLADEGRGPFASSGDTEVVLALLAEGGAGAIDTLEGMFALALWQPQTRSLLLARDRLGLKPLFWTPTDRGLAFASELPALLRHPEVRRDLDAQAVERWLMLGYGVGEDTLIRGVRRLPPGHVLEFSEASGVAVRRWFDLLRAVEAPPSRLSPEAAAEALEPIVRRAVRQRLVADVPLGCFLSGGVDSAVVAAAARAEGHALDTLTIRMEDGIDEGPDAVRQARILDLEHRVAACAVPDLETFLDSWEQVSGDPLADPSLLPTWMVSRKPAGAGPWRCRATVVTNCSPATRDCGPCRAWSLCWRRRDGFGPFPPVRCPHGGGRPNSAPVSAAATAGGVIRPFRACGRRTRSRGSSVARWTGAPGPRPSFAGWRT
jgi:asparagine synthase (glutamine-hydrolysing)